MADYAIVENGVVTDVVVADSALESNWIEITASNTGSDMPDIGSTYDSSTQMFAGLKVLDADESKELAVYDLGQSDWTILDDVGLTGANVDEWKAYRKKLRDIARNPSAGATFPQKPNEEYS